MQRSTGVSGWYPGERMSRLHASHSFGPVLALVVASVLFTAFAPDEPWSGSVLVLLQATTLGLALWTSGLGRTALHLSIGLAGLALVVALLEMLGGTSIHGAAGLFSAALVVATAVVIVVGATDQGEINAQSVIGVLTDYLLIGLLFTFIYSAVAVLGDGTLFAQGTDGTPGDRIYFSYVTLATLGYGDYTPAGEVARMLAVGEALLGQLYLVTVVAIVVARLRPRGTGTG